MYWKDGILSLCTIGSFKGFDSATALSCHLYTRIYRVQLPSSTDNIAQRTLSIHTGNTMYNLKHHHKWTNQDVTEIGPFVTQACD